MSLNLRVCFTIHMSSEGCMAGVRSLSMCSKVLTGFNQKYATSNGCHGSQKGSSFKASRSSPARNRCFQQRLDPTYGGSDPSPWPGKGSSWLQKKGRKETSPEFQMERCNLRKQQSIWSKVETVKWELTLECFVCGFVPIKV